MAERAQDFHLLWNLSGPCDKSEGLVMEKHNGVNVLILDRRS
jgi:hypothetical protein